MWEGRGGGHLSPFNNWDRVAMLEVCPLDPNRVIRITTRIEKISGFLMFVHLEIQCVKKV